jgi:hypothetical protein
MCSRKKGLILSKYARDFQNTVLALKTQQALSIPPASKQRSFAKSKSTQISMS